MIALLLACVHPTPPGLSPAQQRQALHDVVRLPVQDSPLLYLQVTVQAGSAFDPVGQEGVAWLTAQMLRQGGAGDRTPEQVDQVLYDLGADIQVVVDKELVTFRGKALAADAGIFVPLFTELITEPAWDPAAFERLQQQALDHVQTGILDSDERLGDTVLDLWLHEGHPYGHPVQGRAGVLETITLDDVTTWYGDAYVRSAVTAGVAGDVQAGAGFANSLLVLPPDKPLQSTPKPRPRVKGRHLLVVEKPTASTGMHFGHPIDVDRGHDDWPALFLAMVQFGEHRESHGRLYGTLRTERGLNYGDYAYLEHYEQIGWSSTQELGTARSQPQFYVWLRPTTVDNGPFALKLALDLTETLVEEGLSQAEFEQTQAYLSARIGTWAMTPQRRLGFALEARAHRVPDRLVDLPAAIDALSLDDVNDALSEHIHPENLRIVVVTADGQRFVDSVIEDRDTPIVYNGVTPTPEQAAMDDRISTTRLELDTWSIVPAEGIFQ